MKTIEDHVAEWWAEMTEEEKTETMMAARESLGDGATARDAWVISMALAEFGGDPWRAVFDELARLAELNGMDNLSTLAAIKMGFAAWDAAQFDGARWRHQIPRRLILRETLPLPS